LGDEKSLAQEESIHEYLDERRECPVRRNAKSRDR